MIYLVYHMTERNRPVSLEWWDNKYGYYKGTNLTFIDST